MRFDRPSHCASVSSLLATLANCSCVSRAKRSTPGIDLASSSAVRRPPSRLEIVPPVATKWTRGSGGLGTLGGSGAQASWRGSDASKHSRAADRTASGERGSNSYAANYVLADGRRGHEREPFAQLPCSFIGRLTVKRHQRGRHARAPRDLRAPARRGNRRHFDLVRAPGNLFFVVVNGHVGRMLILRVRADESSEARRESGHPVGSGVSIRVRSAREIFFRVVSSTVFRPFIHRFSTGGAKLSPSPKHAIDVRAGVLLCWPPLFPSHRCPPRRRPAACCSACSCRTAACCRATANGPGSTIA